MTNLNITRCWPAEKAHAAWLEDGWELTIPNKTHFDIHSRQDRHDLRLLQKALSEVVEFLDEKWPGE